MFLQPRPLLHCCVFIVIVMRKQEWFRVGIQVWAEGQKRDKTEDFFFFLNVSALLCAQSWLFHWEVQIRHRSPLLPRRCLLPSVFICAPSSPSSEPLSSSSLRSKGAAAARGCLGSWWFDPWPLTLLHLATHLFSICQSNMSKGGGAPASSAKERIRNSAARGFAWEQRGGSRFHGLGTITVWGIKAFHMNSYGLFFVEDFFFYWVMWLFCKNISINWNGQV